MKTFVKIVHHLRVTDHDRKLSAELQVGEGVFQVHPPQ